MEDSFPIELDRCFFTRLCVIANQLHVPGDSITAKKLPAAASEITVAPIEGDDRVFIVTQTVKMDADDKPDHPYSIDVECVGFFRVVDDGMPKEKQQAGAALIGHNVLYAACREAILNVTGRQAWGPFTLGLSILKSRSASD